MADFGIMTQNWTGIKNLEYVYKASTEVINKRF